MDTRYAEATGTLKATLTIIKIRLKSNLEVFGGLDEKAIRDILELIAEQEKKVEKITDLSLQTEKNAV
jgi:hypothetical protein